MKLNSSQELYFVQTCVALLMDSPTETRKATFKKIHTVLKEEPSFAQVKLSEWQALSNRFNEYVAAIKSKYALDVEGANLPGLPEEASEMDSLLLQYVHHVDEEEQKKMAKKLQQQEKQSSLLAIEDSILDPDEKPGKRKRNSEQDDVSMLLRSFTEEDSNVRSVEAEADKLKAKALLVEAEARAKVMILDAELRREEALTRKEEVKNRKEETDALVTMLKTVAEAFKAMVK